MLVRARGADIFIKDQGTGAPILFLHGNPDTADIHPLTHNPSMPSS